jgi:hypothetical protein
MTAGGDQSSAWRKVSPKNCQLSWIELIRVSGYNLALSVWLNSVARLLDCSVF